MACQQLQSSLAQNANPLAGLAEDSRPGTDDFCRSYDFSERHIITFADFPIRTFAGLKIATF